MINDIIPSSFRDPSGFLFKNEGTLYRQIQPSYRVHYEKAESSGLYTQLIAEELLIPHQEVSTDLGFPDAYKIIRPELLPFISYPYEWCFSQLKKAALLTLAIQIKALAKGMILKDASACNIQFRYAKPILIDTLSFEIYEEGKPWQAYQQFCENFLAPLALMSQTDLRLNELFMSHPAGIDLDLASSLLPFHTWIFPSFLMHIHIPAKLRYRTLPAPFAAQNQNCAMNQASLMRIAESLASSIQRMKIKSQITLWKNYSPSESYTPEAIASKEAVIGSYLNSISFKRVWDLGAYDGHFSERASRKADFVLALDSDPHAVEKHFLKISTQTKSRINILPLVMNLSHPSPSLGWENKDALSLAERGPADLIMMLAVIHHLAVSKNIPLPRIALWAAGLCRYLLIEFVPKEDKKVQELLSRREDIFPDYSVKGFEEAFSAHFKILQKKNLSDSLRIMYLLETR